MAKTISALEEERDVLLQELTGVGDMRRGSLTEVFRRCGKDTCRCVDPSHPGHGPYYAYTRKVGGKTKTLQLRAGSLASKIEREVEAGHLFRKTCDKLFDVSEALCEARPLEQVGQADLHEAGSAEAVKKKGSKTPLLRRSPERSRR